ncbi:hypothetical protein PM082_021324 [Marasmius tenuissimus]|nr:hypothetical protein PM082_021324 [Marasmius tenuissimus]
MQDNPVPSTELGLIRMELFVGVNHSLLLYPIGNSLFDTEAKQKKLKALVESTPMVIAALIGIWQHGCNIGLNEGYLSGLLHAVTLCFILLNMENEIYERGLPARVLKEIETNMEARRWDVPRVNMKGNIRDFRCPLLTSPLFGITCSSPASS